MKLGHWFLWEFLVARLAKAHGFLDPKTLMMKIQRFSQPSEVWVPAELLRSGMTLQARGLINSQAIQNNLDWIWPYWVERQFYPGDAAFIPRAFNLTNINLTCRNWTAVGVPDCSDYPLVDPRGLVTPLFDGWSIDAWIIRDDGFALVPAKMPAVSQQFRFGRNIQVITFAALEDASLQSCVHVDVVSGIPTCRISFTAHTRTKAKLLVCVRPYNPEGVSAIDVLKRLPKAHGWNVNDKADIFISEAPDKYIFSNYHSGDILGQLSGLSQEIHCTVGMATSAAFFELVPDKTKEVAVNVPLSQNALDPDKHASWDEHLRHGSLLEIPDKLFQRLYETALRTLILHSPCDVYPGPYTYKRFWFRDAAFILYAMMACGLTKNIEKLLNEYPKRQTPVGYFTSQDGEWDSNGQALWTIGRYAAMLGGAISPALLSCVEAGTRWIKNKRVSQNAPGNHAGLLPAGFSAEHFGPTDFYYWDDFWAIAGLKAAAELFAQHKPNLAENTFKEIWDLENSVEKSLLVARQRLGHDGIPASPYRRMDAGSIGSLIASYPLQLYDAKDPHVLYTVDFLINRHMFEGAYYHELSHSGINIYLTLHLAQVLLRAGDHRFFDMAARVAHLATPTGQWPEAIHPQTKGGCMGDGQHVWAAAEWVMMIRNMFVREEERANKVVLGSGIPAEWLEDEGRLLFGPTNTIFGPVSVVIDVQEDDIQVSWQAKWHKEPPAIEVHLGGCQQVVHSGAETQMIKFNKSNRKAAL